jgi:hypothetical protein
MDVVVEVALVLLAQMARQRQAAMVALARHQA